MRHRAEQPVLFTGLDGEKCELYNRYARAYMHSDGIQQYRNLPEINGEMRSRRLPHQAGLSLIDRGQSFLSVVRNPFDSAEGEDVVDFLPVVFFGQGFWIIGQRKIFENDTG